MPGRLMPDEVFFAADRAFDDWKAGDKGRDELDAALNAAIRVVLYKISENISAVYSDDRLVEMGMSESHRILARQVASYCKLIVNSYPRPRGISENETRVG